MFFPIEKIRPLTHQEVFDIALRTMRNRGYTKSVNKESDTCMYRSSVGPCAIGACIPDALYEPEIESGTRYGGGIGVLMHSDNFKQISKLFSNCNVRFLEGVQNCHDDISEILLGIDERKQFFENKMYEVTRIYNLEFTGLNEQYPTDYDPNKDERYQLK